MKTPDKVLSNFTKYTALIDDEIKLLLKKQESYLMYDMMSYFFGYKNESLKEEKSYGGKRFRPGMVLLLSEYYGSVTKATEIAAAIEIFHNFTLIHDDIEDNDPLRRGKKTVWNIWGKTQAINTGDAQMMLSNLELIKGIKDHNLSVEIFDFLNRTFLAIAEGQHMDITMSELNIENPEINPEMYMKMIGKKSAALIGASAKVAGMIAGKDKKECENLWDYGYNLGLAYQLNDDLLSIWGRIEETGKIEESDLEERKKTLPVIYLYKKLSDTQKKEFAEIYNKKEPLSHAEISLIKNYLNENEAHNYVWEIINEHLQKSKDAIKNLDITEEQKKNLVEINKTLIPDIRFWDA